MRHWFRFRRYCERFGRQRLHRLGDLGVRQDAELLALGEESLDLFEFLQVHN